MANRPRSGGKPPFDRLIAGIPEESLERSLGHVNPESPTTLQLDSVVSLVGRNAKCSPQSLGENLGLSPIVIDGIVSDYKIQQREGVIHRWIEVNGKRATLKKLLEALYHCDEIQSIRLVKDELTVQDRHAPTTVAMDRRAPATAFVTPVQPQMDSIQGMVSSLQPPQKYFEKQHSAVDSPVFMSVKPYSVSPMQLIFTQHRSRAPQRALSTPGSDSEASLPEVSVRLTEVAEARLETSQAGRSELEPGGVFARSSDKGLEEQFRQPDSQMEEVRGTLQKHDDAIKQLQSLALETRNKNVEYDEKILKLQEESESLKKELEIKNKQIEDLISQMDEKQKRLDEAQEELQDTQEKLQESTSDNNALQQEIRKLKLALEKGRVDKRKCEHQLQQVQVELKKNGIDIPDAGVTVSDLDLQPQGDLPDDWTHVQKESLGKGSFGEVFLCDDVVMGRQLAVKVIAIIKGEESRILREVHALKVLRHERIVPFYGTRPAKITDKRGREETYLYIFMGYMPLGSLESYLKVHGPLPENDARRCTVQLVEGVKFLHENNIVHRDIKCANILRDSRERIRLADFGCSKDLEGISGKKSRLAGTAYFLAPESITADHVFKSDIWSVGATVMEMLTGHPPYHDMEPQQVIYSVGSGELTPLVDDRFCREAQTFLEQCFKSDHTQRPTADRLLHASFCQYPGLVV